MSELVKCVECGGNILISSDGKRGKCEYCDQEYFYKEEKDSALVMAMNIATELQLLIRHLLHFQEE